MERPAISFVGPRQQASARSESSGTPTARKLAEHFIPIRHSELVERLATLPGLIANERRALRRLGELLSATIHYEFHRRLQELKTAYAPFDPDADTQSLDAANPGEQGRQMTRLFEGLSWLLERANFTRLGRQDLEEAIRSRSHWGLNLEVDFDVFDHLDIYVRGNVTARLPPRSPPRFRRPRPVETSLFQRLVVVVKLRPGPHTPRGVDTDDVYLKLFKDIPQVDLEMLLPGSRVKMSLLDRTKILVPTLSGGAMTLWKLATQALAAAAAGVSHVVTVCALIGGSVGFGLRSFNGYLRTKQRYQLNLTESLYYRNLDNNAGVLMRLVDEAEEQENREALLAYFFLWRDAPGSGLASDDLDRRIESWLTTLVNRPIDFEIADALEKLRRWRLIELTPQGRWRAAPIARALELLDESWDNFFPYFQAA